MLAVNNPKALNYECHMSECQFTSYFETVTSEGALVRLNLILADTVCAF